MSGKGDKDRTREHKARRDNYGRINWCKHKWVSAAPNPYGITHHCTKCKKTRG